MLRLFCAALAALAILPAWPAFASDDEEEPEAGGEAGEVNYNRTGAYVEVLGSWGVEEFQDTRGINIDDSVGVSGRVGYRMLSWLSAEAQVEYLPNFQIDFSDNHHDNGNLDMLLYAGNVRLNLPTGLIQPYLLGGGGWMDANLGGTKSKVQDGHGAFGQIGAGVEFYPWEHVALDIGLAYVIPTGDVSKLDVLSVTWGAMYRF